MVNYIKYLNLLSWWAIGGASVMFSNAKRRAQSRVVTTNLRDFAPMPQGIEARPPDYFLCDLFDLNPALLVDIIREQAVALRNPPVAVEELLRGLARFVPEFAKLAGGATER